MFVAINLVLDKEHIINTYPIIYSSLEEDISIEEELKGNEDLINYIRNKIHFSKFDNVSLNYSFITTDESVYEGNINLCDFFDILSIYNYKDFINEDLKYLYKCVFKKDLHNTDPVFIYNSIYSKYPNRVNIEVVVNYIKSKLKDKYPNLKSDIIERIGNNLKNEIS